ncbi:MAG: hypothetical protein PHY85_10840 [Bacteroidales bacterium]|nr:hypothetical protein [Bacteroidales bacterium]
MYSYKFRVTTEEVEDFVRDIEVLSNQTFEQFHYFIMESLEISQSELASFFICDQKWRKKQEITLIDMGVEDVQDDSDEDDDGLKVSPKIPCFVMKDAVLNQFMDDPHQKILYEYNYTNPIIFEIELLRTTQSIQRIEYPRCTQLVGKLPDNKNNIFPIIGEISDDLDIMADFGDDLDESDFDNEVYDNDFDTDQISEDLSIDDKL